MAIPLSRPRKGPAADFPPIGAGGLLWLPQMPLADISLPVPYRPRLKSAVEVEMGRLGRRLRKSLRTRSGDDLSTAILELSEGLVEARDIPPTQHAP